MTNPRNPNPLRLAMIGCGKVGGPTAKFLEEVGHDVRRYDTAFDTGFTLDQAIADRDLVLIAVPTPHQKEYDGSKPSTELPPRDFSYDILASVVHKVAALTTSPIVIISTVLPGTIRRLFGEYGERIIYNPYLISMGAVIKDLANPDLVIAGTVDGKKSPATDMLLGMHGSITPGKNVFKQWKLGTWEEAESIKIFYNTFISTKLSLVNMVQDVAMKIGNMNVDVVTEALTSSTQRILTKSYMTAGMGDGGPCHPRDNIVLRWLAEELHLGYDLFEGIMSAREQQARNLASFIVGIATSNSLPVFINGKAFKPKTELTDGSYSLLVAHYIEEMGVKVNWLDPKTGDYLPPMAWGVILLAHNEGVTYNHQFNTPVYTEVMPGSIIVDPWRKYISNDPDIKVIHYGNTRSPSE